MRLSSPFTASFWVCCWCFVVLFPVCILIHEIGNTGKYLSSLVVFLQVAIDAVVFSLLGSSELFFPGVSKLCFHIWKVQQIIDDWTNWTFKRSGWSAWHLFLTFIVFTLSFCFWKPQMVCFLSTFRWVWSEIHQLLYINYFCLLPMFLPSTWSPQTPRSPYSCNPSLAEKHLTSLRPRNGCRQLKESQPCSPVQHLLQLMR